MTPASKLTADLLIAISREFPDIKVWRSNRIDAMALGKGGKLRRVQAGINGQADLTGIIGPTGERLEIEVKAGRDQQSADQKSFEQMITMAGGVYLVARTVEGTLGMLEHYAKRTRSRDHHEVGYTGI